MDDSIALALLVRGNERMCRKEGEFWLEGISLHCEQPVLRLDRSPAKQVVRSGILHAVRGVLFWTQTRAVICFVLCFHYPFYDVQYENVVVTVVCPVHRHACPQRLSVWI